MRTPSNPIFSRIIPITFLLFVVLFKFQNCAPTPEQMASSTPIDGEVRIVDRWSEQKVAFLEPSVVVPPERQSIDLQGLCVGSEKGQMIEYQIVEIKDSPEIIEVGRVECIMGGFELPIAQIQFSSCNSRLQVRAAREGEETTYAETVLQPTCPGS